MDTLPERLIDSIVARTCILCLGPDISESAEGYKGLPSSWQLADELARLCGYRGQYRPLPRMAQIYRHRFDEHQLVNYLRTHLTSEIYKPLPIHEIVAHIPFHTIIYAGWDSLLEMALRPLVNPFVVCSDREVPLATGKECVIYKPFGSLDIPETLKITQEQQFNVSSVPNDLLTALHHLVTTNDLLILGYAIDHNSLFVQLYQQARRNSLFQHPAFVIQSFQHPEDATYWETLDVQTIVDNPTSVLYQIAQKVAARQNRVFDLPEPHTLSRAPLLSELELSTQTAMMGQVLDTLGISELVEQTDIPLLSNQQLRDLEAMRATYERIAQGLRHIAEAAPMWLKQGNIEYERQNYERAEEYYQRALQAQPELAEAYHNLHYVYLAQSTLLAAAEQRADAQAKLIQAHTVYQQAILHKPSLALLPEQYVIEAVIGEGGMGIVYRVHDRAINKTVAVKLLKRSFLYNQKADARFRREAILLQRLKDDHIVQCLAFQEYEGRQFIVMDYLGEQTVERLLHEQGTLALDTAHEIVQQVGQALHVAHQAGIVHRDIKPSNIFWVNDQAMVIDFSLAVDLTAGQPSTIGLTSGTVRYMAPEQQRGEPVDQRTDIYALATVFYELLTGRHPGEGAYAAISDLVPNTTPMLDLVVEHARQAEPAQRYPDISAFCSELRRVVNLQPASVQAAWWRRGIAWYQHYLQQLSQEQWYILPGFSILLSFVLPAIVLPGTIRYMSRFVGILLWNVFLSATLSNLLTVFLARRTQFLAYAMYGLLIGSLLGFYITISGWTTFSAANFFGQLAFEMDWTDTFTNYVFHSLFLVILSLLSYLALRSAVTLGKALSLRESRASILGYGLLILILLGFATLMRLVFWGG